MPSTLEMKVFISHSFKPPPNVFDRTEFRAAITRLLTRANDVLHAESIHLYPFFEFSDFQSPFSAQLMEHLEGASLAIVDISLDNPNVMFELGFFAARGVPCLVTRSASPHATFTLPSDLADRVVCQFGQPAEIVDSCFQPLLACARQAAAQGWRNQRLLHDLWFEADTAAMHLVAPPSYDDLPSGDPISANYIYLDQFGDKDAILELVMLLSRNYPRARVVKWTADDFPRKHHVRENLVIVGGPGADGQGGNLLTRDTLQRTRSRVRYTDDCEGVLLEGRSDILRATHSPSSGLLRDFGYFAAFTSPFDRRSRVIVVAGLHTAGVRGAALAFGDLPECAANFAAIGEFEGRGFEALFPVEVVEGEVLVPQVDPEWVWGLG